MSFLLFLAQATQPSGGPPWWADPQKMIFPLIGGAVLVMLFTSNKTTRKEEKKRQGMLSDLKRGDRVQTIGGVFGTVVDARPGDVILKVDESSNTKIKFSRDAIKRIVTDEDSIAK